MVRFLYVLSDFRRLTCEGLFGLAEKTPDKPCLLIATEGRGKLWAGDKEYALSRGKGLSFGPGTPLRIANRSESRLALYLAEFDRVELDPTGPADWELGEGEFYPKSFARMEELALELYAKRDARSGSLEAYGNQALFHELAYLAMAGKPTDRERQATDAVERAIARLRQFPERDLSLKELAEEAGLSPRHYSRIFSRLTGQSPIDYQIGLRLNRAKGLLSAEEASVHRVAYEVGFRDPFHFSRSFKKHTGVTPKLYSRLKGNDVRLASLQFLGEMLALGIKPVGAPKQLLDCRYFDGRTEGIQAIGDSVVTPYLDKLAEIKPDAIVTFNGFHLADYSKIAHTFDVTWTMPFFDRFRLIADKFGKAEEADRWLDRYGRMVADAKERLSRFLEEKQTVSFFWMRGLPETFQAYIDVGALYRDVGFRAPRAIEAIRERPGHPFKVDVPSDELPAYAGDHLFVVVSDDPVSRREFDRLTASPAWRSLEAVRRGRVHRLTEDWLRVDPVSLAAQIAELTERMVPRDRNFPRG